MMDWLVLMDEIGAVRLVEFGRRCSDIPSGVLPVGRPGTRGAGNDLHENGAVRVVLSMFPSAINPDRADFTRSEASAENESLIEPCVNPFSPCWVRFSINETTNF